MSETIRAALAVVIAGGRTVLVRRWHRLDPGLWGFPGGRIEAGEGVEDAALRELREETGLGARALARLGGFDLLRNRSRYRLEAVLCDPLGDTVTAGDDAEEARWFPVVDVIAGRIPQSRDVARLCLRAAHRRP